ncbi:MAG: hypothetical protein E6G46_11055 [Actinobacteria bacterium]|nr:MAG: hypothetical protein E6G46_11055 [Actinomycetota bacterium]
MRKLVVSRALAVLAAMCLMTGLLMILSSPASAQTPSASPSASSTASPSPSATSSSPSGNGLPSPLDSLIPGSSASPSPSATEAPSNTTPGGNNADVLGQTIPKTGADRALPLLIAGLILAATSVAVRRVLARRS